MDIRHQYAQPGKLLVLVVDGSGTPLSGVSVRGDYQTNPTEVASTCCVDATLGEQTTGRDGVVVLDAPPRTFRPVTVTASRPGWPSQTVPIGFGRNTVTDSHGRIVITLGPPREIRGRVDMGPDCPPGFVEVTGALPQMTAPVDSDGQFVLRGLSPSAVSIGFSACGRNAGAMVEPGASSPIVLALPPRKPGPWPFDAPPLSASRAPSSSPATLTARSSCLQPSGELVALGEFEDIVLDERCRFVLAGKRSAVARYEASDWTLLRPDGTKLPIGASLRGSPDIGENVIYLSVPGEETTAEVVDIGRGTRELVQPPARFLAAIHDATVLVRPAITRAGSQAHQLEIRWYDGTRRRLPGPVISFSLVRNKSLLVYRVVPGKRSVEDVHLLDLETRLERVIAKSVLQTYVVDEGRALEIVENDRVSVYDLERNSRHVLAGPVAQWHVFSSDLALKTDAEGGASLYQPNATLPLPFRWPHGVRARKLTEHYLLFGDEGDAVLVDTTNGTPRALASGVRVSDSVLPPLSGDRLALSESSGRALVASLSGEPLRAVGRGVPRVFSPDGRWLAIVREIENEITLAPLAGNEKPVSLQGWGGAFAPDAPALFFHTGKGAYNEPRPLYVTYPALGRTLELEPRVLSYLVLRGGEVLVVVPPGGKRAAGIYRRAVPP